MTLTTLKQWQNGVRLEQISHARAAARYIQLHQIFGMIVTVFSVAVGTSVFSTLATANKKPWVAVLVGSSSIAAAILSSLQTFLNYSGLSTQHRNAANKFGAIRHRIDELIDGPEGSTEWLQKVGQIREDWDKLVEDCPIVPQSYYDAARKIANIQPAVPAPPAVVK